MGNESIVPLIFILGPRWKRIPPCGRFKPWEIPAGTQWI